MDIAMNKPYVLTDDLSLVFAQYTSDHPNLSNEIDQASQMIQSSLAEFFPIVEKISADRIKKFLERKSQDKGLSVLSLTPLLPANNTNIVAIEGSRTVEIAQGDSDTFNFQDIGILQRCTSIPPIQEQFLRASRYLSAKEDMHINICDDVIFSGGTIIEYIKKLNNEGIQVDTVIANVAIQGGINRLNSMNIKVDADFVCDDVIDEVCMRDFIIGAPNGGRNLRLQDGNFVSVPYIYPFANVGSWASLSDKQAQSFSKICTEASILIWSSIDRNIKFSDLPKPIFNCNSNDRVVDRLQSILRNKEYERFANTL